MLIIKEEMLKIDQFKIQIYQLRDSGSVTLVTLTSKQVLHPNFIETTQN